MSNNYVKKYECGNLGLDLPYANCIYELPLLSFSDMRNGLTLSLVFNRDLKERGGNPFDIVDGYKLNLQKRIFWDGNTLCYQGGNGKTERLNEADEIVGLHTFNDDSRRIVRSVNSGFVLESSDYSKEVFNSDGNIIEAYDKYGDKLLCFQYTANKLSSIQYREGAAAKTISFGYDTASRIISIRYSGNSSDITSLSYGTYHVFVSHYSGVTYSLYAYEKSFTALVSGIEDSETFSYGKKCLVDSNDGYTYILSDWVGEEEVYKTQYRYSHTIDSPYVSHNHVEITDNLGVKTRVQFSSGKMTYSYEIGENDTEFLNNYYVGNVNVYRTEDNVHNVQTAYVQKHNSGIPMVAHGARRWSYNASDFDMENGYFVLSGWIKQKDENVQDEFKYVSVIPTPSNLTYEFYLSGASYNKWTYFAFKFFIIPTQIDVLFPDGIIESKDVRISYQATHVWSEELKDYIPISEDALIHKTNGTVIPLSEIFFSAYGYDPEYDFSSYADLLRYILNKKKGINLNEFYYSNNKVVVPINQNSSIKFGYRSQSDAETYFLSDYYLCKRSYSKKGVFTTVIQDDQNDCLLLYKTIDENGNVIASQKYNGYMDVVCAMSEGVTTTYTRDKGLVTETDVNGEYSTSMQYDESSGVITATDEFGHQTKYAVNMDWGTVEKVEFPDTSAVTDTYDADRSTLEAKKFGTIDENRTHSFGYKGGNLSSLSCGDLNYGFSYSKGELAGVSKIGTSVVEYTNTPTSVKSSYPEASGANYAITHNYDKYGRLVSIDSSLSAAYDVYPTFDSTTGDLVPTVDNANARLAMLTDNSIGKVSRYKYNDDGDLLEKTVTNAHSFSSKVSSEAFEYDSGKRLTKHTFKNEGDLSASIEEISYVTDYSDPFADGRVAQYTYTSGNNVLNTTNTYDSYKRISRKIHALSGRVFSSTLQYENTRIKKEINSVGGTTEYEYDACGRITSVKENNKLSTYQYDKIGQLIRENNKHLDKTFIYSYNEIGNITSVKTYAYAEAGTTPTGSYTTKSYTYDGTHKDKLTNFNGTSINYNTVGCPTKYQGKSLAWVKGKLTGMSSGTFATGTRSYSFVYNAQGQRVTSSYKFLEGTSSLTPIETGEAIEYTTSYRYDHFGRLHSESTTKTLYGIGSDTTKIEYLYDESGVVGFKYTYAGVTTPYYYRRNLQGDVIEIYDTGNSRVVRYDYDAWGNCTIASGTTNQIIARANPIRYRGYYYDVETELYYLNARYYSPIWRRFISPDDTAYLDSESVNGLNLYAYCFNDPINYADPSGCFPVLAVILCGIALVGMGLTIGGVASDNNTLTAVGLGMVGAAALVSGGIALARAIATGATLTGIIGGVTATAGLGSLGFMSAEIQEATGNGNWIMDTTGMSDGLYNTLLLSTAAIATLGTAASSVSSAFNIKSINGFGKYGDYYGIKFQTGAGKTRVLSFHNHGHKVAKGIKSIGEWHWQLQKWNPIGNRTSGTIARWIWWSLTRM